MGVGDHSGGGGHRAEGEQEGHNCVTKQLFSPLCPNRVFDPEE